MAGLTLAAGALIAAEKDDRRFWTYWKEALRREVTVYVPAGVVAQVWRGNHAKVACVLNACVIETLDEKRAKGIGVLLAASGTTDIVDAAIVLGAIARDDAIVTADPDDLRVLGDAAGYELTLLPV